MITFKNTETNEISSFYEKVNLIIDENLSIALAKENYNNGECKLAIQLDEDILLKDLMQLKVNVTGTGYFIFNFRPGQLNEEIKNEIFSKLKELKTDGPKTEEGQIQKVTKMLEIVNQYDPLFASFVNNGTPILTKSSFIKITESFEFKSTLFVLMLPFDYSFETNQPKKKSGRGQSKPTPIKKEEPEVTKDGKFDFKAHLKKYGYDYLFMFLFSLIMATSFLFGLALAKKGDASSIFLFVISAVFIGVLAYAILSYEKSYKNWKFNLSNTRFIFASILIGLIAGNGIGFGVSQLVVKGTEENPINYGQIVLISILATIGMAILSVIIPEIIKLFTRKSKKNK